MHFNDYYIFGGMNKSFNSYNLYSEKLFILMTHALDTVSSLKRIADNHLIVGDGGVNITKYKFNLYSQHSYNSSIKYHFLYLSL